MNTFKLYTFGCKVNQYETQVMREQLLGCGLEEVNSDEPADLYIVNTCTVTAKADRECRNILRKVIKENHNAEVIAAGCYAERDADEIKRIDSRIKMLTNEQKRQVLKQFPKQTCMGLETVSKTCTHITHFKGHTRAFVKIQDGCDNFCSYCKVPYVRGRPKSRPKDEILTEAKTLINNGYKELVLTGVCLGAYGKDLNEDIGLADILADICAQDGDFRVRLSSIELADIGEKLIKLIKKSNKVCNHLHIPLQSGDNEILKMMNRRYKIEEFIQRIKSIREKIPGIAISTDVIIGFPGETDKNFKNTQDAIAKIRPMRTHIFSYSPRQVTAAFKLGPGADRQTIKRRYKSIKDITDKLAHDYAQEAKKKRQCILIENTRDKNTQYLCGYTNTYIKITLDGPDEWMGKFVYLVLN